ncbi:RepB family plasmid replication initiator protein, partial [Campylobacter fetus]
MAREKPKELVKYDNDLNLVAFKDFSKVENDVFFALMWKLKEQGNKEIRLDFSELRELI